MSMTIHEACEIAERLRSRYKEQDLSLIKDALHVLIDALTWKPIETAPKDGTEILGYRQDCGVLLIRWTAPVYFMADREIEEFLKHAANQKCLHQEDWFCADFAHGSRLDGDAAPTHWLPLPEPPQ